MRQTMVVVAMALALAGCAYGPDDRVLGGALIGGGTGALVGGLARPDSWRWARGRFDWRRGRRDYRRRYEAGLVLLLGAPSPPLCALLIRLKFSDARSMIYDFAERIFASDAFRFLNGA